MGYSLGFFMLFFWGGVLCMGAQLLLENIFDEFIVPYMHTKLQVVMSLYYYLNERVKRYFTSFAQYSLPFCSLRFALHTQL
jgi:hypothetical protein